MPKQKQAPTYVKESSINEYEVIVFRVLQPANGRWFPNGYLRGRVYPGQTTEIPRWHPVRDKWSQEQVTDEDGERLYRENKVPKGCELLGYEDRMPRRRNDPAPVGTKTTATKPTKRAADVPVGA